MQYCTDCGQMLSERVRFCPSCGTKSPLVNASNPILNAASVNVANCMICNVEFDPTKGTSKNFCPEHCAPSSEPMTPGEVTRSPSMGCAPLIIFVICLGSSLGLLFAGEFGWAGALLFFVAVISLTVHKSQAQSVLSYASKQMICPHCQKKGGVNTTSIIRKVGVSGGKATAAVLTGGVSLLATGLSRKEPATRAHCGNCGASWTF